MDIEKLVTQIQQEQNFYQALFQKNQTILDLAAELLAKDQQENTATETD